MFKAAIVVKVNDLAMCRVFYRDILALGEPVTDSSIRTEFDFNANCRLVLVKVSPGEVLPPPSERLLFCIVSDRTSELADRLATCGYAPVTFIPSCGCQDGVSDGAFAFRDPEGNLFLLAQG